MMLNWDEVDSPYIRVFSKQGSYELDLAPGMHQLRYSQSFGSQVSGGQINTTISYGQWYHVAIVSDNLQVSLYLNGQKQTQFQTCNQLLSSGAWAQTYGNGTQLCCGFPGSLRQFRIWNRARQAVEVTSYSTKLLTANEYGLIDCWPLDDGNGSTLHDIGLNQR